jgi:hypothetical protein
MGTGVLSAAASTPLQWNSPNEVTSGAPVPVSSVNPCPPPPPGDTVIVAFFLAFPGGGGVGEVLNANANGSWSGNVTFNFSGVSGKALLSATCQNFNGVTGVNSARYQPHRVRAVSS